RSIALDPKNAEAHHQYGAVLSWLGRDDEANLELHLALALDPDRAITFDDLAAWTHVRDTALAVALADSAVALEPGSAFSRRWRALARLWGGDVRGAREDAELANRLQPGDIVMESVLAIVLAHAGDGSRARALIAHWPGRPDHWLSMAALVAVADTAHPLDPVERAPHVPYRMAARRMIGPTRRRWARWRPCREPNASCSSGSGTRRQPGNQPRCRTTTCPLRHEPKSNALATG